MKKTVALTLSKKAKEVAWNFSQPRELNPTNETFELKEIIPLSETTAYAKFLKSSGKLAVAFFYFLNNQGGHWEYFFPTDSHIIGMSCMNSVLREVERHNFPLNFQTTLKVM